MSGAFLQENIHNRGLLWLSVSTLHIRPAYLDEHTRAQRVERAGPSHVFTSYTLAQEEASILVTFFPIWFETTYLVGQLTDLKRCIKKETN